MVDIASFAVIPPTGNPKWRQLRFHVEAWRRAEDGRCYYFADEVPEDLRTREWEVGHHFGVVDGNSRFWRVRRMKQLLYQVGDQLGIEVVGTHRTAVRWGSIIKGTLRVYRGEPGLAEKTLWQKAVVIAAGVSFPDEVTDPRILPIKL